MIAGTEETKTWNHFQRQHFPEEDTLQTLERVTGWWDGGGIYSWLWDSADLVIHFSGLLVKWGQCHQPSTCFRNPILLWPFTADFSFLNEEEKHHPPPSRSNRPSSLVCWLCPKLLCQTSLAGLIQPWKDSLGCPGWSKRHAIFKCLNQLTKVPVHLYFSPATFSSHCPSPQNGDHSRCKVCTWSLP